MLRRLTPPLLAALIVGAVAASAGTAAHPPVAIFPAQGTLTANPDTQVSFRGASAGELSVTVSGSRSGVHSGHLAAHSDGQGASFLPDKPFRYGELVTVRANLPLVGQSHGAVHFRILTHAGHWHLGFAKDSGGTPPGAQRFLSRPDLQPPSIVVTKRDPLSAGQGDVFVSDKAGRGQDGTIISDDRGQLVWFKQVPKHTSAFDFRVQRYRGNPVLTWWQGRARPGQGLGVGEIYDSSYRHIATVHAGNGYQADLHEFELSPRSTALILAYKPVTFGGALAMDTLVQEIDIPTGLVMFEWHSLGNISSRESHAPHVSGQPYDVAHLNSIQMLSDGNLLVSSRHTSTVFKISATTGRILWRLGGRRSDFKMTHASHFISQHHARLQPDGSITLFDNGGPPKPGRPSRALWLNVDEQHMTVSVRKSYRYPHPLRGFSQGSMQVLPGGDVFVGWGGNEPFFSEFTGGGRIIWNAHFKPDGDDTYRAYRFPWTGRPTAPPDVAARSGGGHTGVYASWNGATQVARWQVLAGDSPSVLLPVKTAPRRGFETHITIDGERKYVAVRALGADGLPLGTSRAVQPRSKG